MLVGDYLPWVNRCGKTCSLWMASFPRLESWAVYKGESRQLSTGPPCSASWLWRQHDQLPPGLSAVPSLPRTPYPGTVNQNRIPPLSWFCQVIILQPQKSNYDTCQVQKVAGKRDTVQGKAGARFLDGLEFCPLRLQISHCRTLLFWVES